MIIFPKLINSNSKFLLIQLGIKNFFEYKIKDSGFDQ